MALGDGTSATYRVVTENAGQRLDNFLLGLLKGVPRARIYSMLRKGEVRVNGGRCRPSRRLAAGDVVRIPPVRALRLNENTRPAAGDHAAGERMRLADAVLYEDEHLMVLNKPAGVAVHGGSGVSLGVIEALRAMHPGGAFELIHRLDRDTSGCLAIAKDRSTLLQHHAAFREGRVKKRYELVVHGRWLRRVRSVRAPLLRYVLPNGERRVRPDAAGMRARTDFELRRRAGACHLAAGVSANGAYAPDSRTCGDCRPSDHRGSEVRRPGYGHRRGQPPDAARVVACAHDRGSATAIRRPARCVVPGGVGDADNGSGIAR